MTDLESLLDEVKKAGVWLETDGERLSAIPAGVLPERLKLRLRERKPDIIRRLLTESELSASMKRLEAADIRLAVFITATDAGLIASAERMVQGEDAAQQAWRDGAIVFDAQEMFCYIALSRAERQLFLSLKRIGGRP